ncbi:MAG: hypothetical protein ACYCUV_04630 [Phycisphaerae bacterium]
MMTDNPYETTPIEKASPGNTGPEPGMGRCSVTGKWVPEDALVTFQGQLVCAEGKQILLDRLRIGEDAQSPGITRSSLVRVAGAQRAILWLILVYFAAMVATALSGGAGLHALSYVVPFVYLAVIVIGLILVYRLARATESSAPWLYVVLLVIPIGGLIGLLILNGKATRILRDAGLRVGLIGVNRSDLDRFQSGNI